MTYRDDHDAALARADALAAEVDELKEQLAAAKQPRAPASPAAKQPQAPASPARRGRLRWSIIALALVGVVGLAVVLYVVLRSSSEPRPTKRANVPPAPVAFALTWETWTSVEPCVLREAIEETVAERASPDKLDPRTPDAPWASGMISRLFERCDGVASRLATDAELRDSLAAWRAANDALVAPAHALEAYYSAKAWKDDGFAAGPKLWRDVDAVLVTRRAARNRVRAEALPLLRARIEAAGHAAARLHRAAIASAVRLGLRLWRVEDAAASASGLYDGKPFDDAAAGSAAAPAMTELLAALPEAPPEQLRLIRSQDATEDAIAAGKPMTIDQLYQLRQMEPLRDFARGENTPPRP